eukprot:11228349-Lingulodinium_polyedra.AAC.4
MAQRPPSDDGLELLPHHDRLQELEHMLRLSLPRQEPRKQRQCLLDGPVKDVLGPWRLQRQWKERLLSGNGTQVSHAHVPQELGQDVSVAADAKLSPLVGQRLPHNVARKPH